MGGWGARRGLEACGRAPLHGVGKWGLPPHRGAPGEYGLFLKTLEAGAAMGRGGEVGGGWGAGGSGQGIGPGRGHKHKAEWQETDMVM